MVLNLNVLYLLLVVYIFIMQSSHSRVVGIVCRNPSCRRPFASMHAYHQHRRHPSNKGTLCANITSMSEIVVDRRANIATAILRREHESGKACGPQAQVVNILLILYILFNMQNMDYVRGCTFKIDTP